MKTANSAGEQPIGKNIGTNKQTGDFGERPISKNIGTNKQTGDFGERLAVKFLSGKGYTILETKFRTRAGEIDIIARDNDCIVFVEVKLRKGISMGYPLEAVGYRKQQKIRKTALYYMTLRNITTDMRFDVIEIIGVDNMTVEHIENAF